MKKYLVLFASSLLLACAAKEGRNFDTLLKRCASVPEEQRAALLDDFIRSTPFFPLPEDSAALFLYRGKADSVSMAGDMTGWGAAPAPLTRIPGTGVWYRRIPLEPDARIEYKLVVDGQWMTDPLNPHDASGPFGSNSELRMPAYAVRFDSARDPYIPQGTLFDTTFNCSYSAKPRPIRMYMPPGYETGDRRYPLLLFQDGSDYIRYVGAPAILDRLIHEKQMGPVLALFVPPLERGREYSGDLRGEYIRFIAGTLVPWAESRFRTLADPSKRAVLGASDGGNISLCIGLRHPGLFGCVVAHSSNVQEDIRDAFRDGPEKKLRFYMDLGKYDIPVLIPRVRECVSVLRSRGYDVVYREYPEGHNWGFWRAHLGDALILFFPFSESGSSSG